MAATLILAPVATVVQVDAARNDRAGAEHASKIIFDESNAVKCTNNKQTGHSGCAGPGGVPGQVTCTGNTCVPIPPAQPPSSGTGGKKGK